MPPWLVARDSESELHPLIALFDRAVAEGFIRADNRSIVVAAADPAALLDELSKPPASPEAEWIRTADEA